MIKHVNGLSISDVSSVKAQSSMLTGLTGETKEMSRDGGDQVQNQCIRLTNSLSSFSAKSSVEDLKHAASGIMGAMGNIQGGVNDALAGRATVLESDIETANALPAEFDADIENYWTNPNNFKGPNGELLEGQALKDEVNLQKQKRAAADAAQKNARVLESIQVSVSNHMSVGDDFNVDTPSLSVKIVKASAKNISSNISLSNGKVNAPTYCEMIGEVVNKTVVPPGTPITDLVYDPEEKNNCENKILTVQSQSTPMAPSGNNGNDAAVGTSGAVSLSLNDENGDPIPISGSAPIDIWITKDSAPADFVFNRVNATDLFPVNKTVENDGGNSTNATSTKKRFNFMQNGLKIFTNDASLHMHVKPDDFTQAYLMVLKKNGTPNCNATKRNFDYLKVLCPNSSDIVDDGNDTYYLFFLNIAEINNYKGQVGFGIRELNSSESTQFCGVDGGLFMNDSSPEIPPLTDSNFTLSFTSDFELRIYSSGCYYFDLKTGNWMSDGLEIMKDTTATSAHCVATHLTDFAGGFAVVVPSINFDDAFANASFLDNPVIYSTIMAITALYIILSIISRFKDVRDKKRFNIVPLEDNKAEDSYFYELIILTGSRADSGTDSTVRIIITGEENESEIRVLNSCKKYSFKRGGVDSFVVAVNKPLGPLSYVRIWHDNSGFKEKASWFLKNILIHDLQTREKFYFFNQRWLAVEREDGAIDRILPVAGEAQKREIKSLASKQAKTKLTDGHLWISIIAKPAHSSFTRLERTTACFVLMYISMLMNILYYGVSEEIESEGIMLGPVKITMEQILIGVLSNLITFPPTFIIVQLFRRSRARVTRTARLRQIVKESFEKAHEENDDDSDGEFNDLNRAGSPDTNGQFIKTKVNLNESNQVEDDVEEEEVKPEDYEKPKRPLTFPWWCRIIAMIMSYACMIVSIFFIIVRGLEFGNDKVTKWVTSLVISFITSVFLTQPIQALGMAVILAIIFRKFSEDLEDDREDDGKSLNDYAKWQSLKHKQKTSYKFESNYEHKISVLTTKQLKEARIKRIDEIKTWRYLRDIGVNIIFMIILFLLAYNINGSKSYDYQDAIGTVLNPSGDFDNIARIEDFYKWAGETLAPALRVSTYYNGDQAYYLAGFLGDFSSRLLGFATMRQLRVQNTGCKIIDKMQSTYGECYPELDSWNEEKHDFNYGWTPKNLSYVPPNGMGAVYNSFSYQSAHKLKGSPYQGVYASYGGGGHVYELRGKLSHIVGNLSLLQQNNWIDRSTRAVFIEFSAYNPNINLFVVTTMLIEFLPSGNLIKTSKYECINLMETGNPAIKIVYMVFYMLFVIYFALKAIKQFLKQRMEYLRGFWTYIEWLLIIFSCISVQMFVNRIEKADEISRYFVETKGYAYIKLQDVNLSNQLIVLTLSCCCAFQTVKFLQLFRFNNKIYMLALTLNYCAEKVMGFMLVFMVIWLAFVQLMFLYFNEHSTAYSNLLRSMLTSFQILLGKFEIGPLLAVNPLFGSILFTSYNIIIVLLLMNTFISIICDSFEDVRQELTYKPNDFEIFDYFKNKFKALIPKITKSKRVRNMNQIEEDEEKEERERIKLINENLHLVLTKRIDNLIKICSVVS